MSGHETEERISIKSAAKTLGLTEKTVQRYLAKGLLTKIKETNRTYLLASEIKALAQTQTGEQGQTRFGHAPGSKKPLERDIVSMDRSRYEALLIEVGELRKQVELLLEYRSMLQTRQEAGRDKEKEIEQLRARLKALEAECTEKDGEISAKDQRIKELEAELGRFTLEKPWWQR